MILFPLSLPGRAEVKDTLLLFDMKQVQMNTISVNDDRSTAYLKIGYGTGLDAGYVEQPGHPQLPFQHITISLPHEAENVEVTGNAERSLSFPLEYKVFPVQHPVPTGLGYETPAFCRGDAGVYGSKYPASPVSLTDVSCFGEGNRLVGVNVYPITYYPQEGRCELAEKMSIRVSYTRGRTGQKVRSFASGKCPTSLPIYEYCIITSRGLSAAFSRLIGWERQKGLNAGAVCVEDILSDPAIKGDTVSSLYDDAGKIRQYLQYAYKYGNTRYVLFGGNDTIAPVRYGTGMNNTFDYQGDEEALHIPTDFYYAELNSSWNKDGDKFYGEPQDLDDYMAELSVGRLLVTGTDDIENYTDKLLRYELNPGNGDFSYLRKAIYTQADQMQVAGQANAIADELKDIFPEKTIVEESPGPNEKNTVYPTGNDVIREMRKHYGFMSCFNHGHPMAITVKADGLRNNPYAVTSLTEEETPWVAKEDCNGLDSLENKDYPMVAYSFSCSITPFDVYKDIFKNKPCIGQSFTSGKDYGGAALIGNTRVGWVSTSFRMQKAFDRYFPYHSIGDALNLAKFSNTADRHHHALVVNVIGSPDIDIWTGTPQMFHINTSEDSWQVTDSTEDIQVCKYDLVSEISSMVNYDIVRSDFLRENVANCVVTLKRRNWIPKILPLFIRNISLNGSKCLLVSDMSVGSALQGNEHVEIPSGSNISIEKSGLLKLCGNVTVEKGATLVVKQSKIIK